ncbi:hypothetical protein Syun_002130 [Stephania yunnanensis]|uniref:Cytochrome P450 n=1 Tax=Stephania yunnanensis TaxID=152371 RepID=A0AAP0Q755_9MAGN
MPERFLTTNADMDVKGQSYELLPFGSGRRSCPGVGLALQVMHLTLARILQAFELKTQSGVGVDLEECSGILLSMLNPLQVLVAPRLPRKVRKITKSSSFNGKGAVVNKNNAPEPPGAWPIIGHLPLLVFAKQPHRAFAALAEKYGPAFMVRMGMSSPMLIVSSREVAKECYTAKDHVFATRLSLAGKLMAYDHSVMGFTPFGTYWREIRKIATVELFSARRIGMLKPVRRSEVSLWMKGLHEKWVLRMEIALFR